MLTKELFKKIRRIEITTSRLVTEAFVGQYHSVFKGQGMEFDEVREYIPGDDIRNIDWNVTARTGVPHIKKYVEERELTVMIMVDASRSCHFASRHMLKNRLAAEIAAVLAFSAIRNNDKVGLIFFTDRIEKFLPPRKGVKNVLRLIREILYFRSQNTKTDIGRALEFLSKVTRRRCVAFLISDFVDTHGGDVRPQPGAASFQRPLMIANKRHDLIAVTLNDLRERELPDGGLLRLRDAETGQPVVMDTSSRRVREQYRRQFLDRQERLHRVFQRTGVDHIDIDTDQPYMQEFVTFFARRKSRRH